MITIRVWFWWAVERISHLASWIAYRFWMVARRRYVSALVKHIEETNSREVEIVQFEVPLPEGWENGTVEFSPYEKIHSLKRDS